MNRFRRWRTIRIISQAFFFAVFFVLLWQARYPLEGPFPMDLFLRLDPLLGILLSIASRVVIFSFALSLVILFLSLVFGRAFCGWICPLGTTLDVTDHLMKSRHHGTHVKTRWWKYVVLIALVIAAVLSYQGTWLWTLWSCWTEPPL